MNWLNTKYMIRAGVLTMLLLFPSLLSATCKPDTIIRNYKPDSLKLAIKADCGKPLSLMNDGQTSLPQKLGTHHSDPL